MWVAVPSTWCLPIFSALNLAPQVGGLAANLGSPPGQVTPPGGCACSYRHQLFLLEADKDLQTIWSSLSCLADEETEALRGDGGCWALQSQLGWDLRSFHVAASPLPRVQDCSYGSTERLREWPSPWDSNFSSSRFLSPCPQLLIYFETGWITHGIEQVSPPNRLWQHVNEGTGQQASLWSLARFSPRSSCRFWLLLGNWQEGSRV